MEAAAMEWVPVSGETLVVVGLTPVVAYVADVEAVGVVVVVDADVGVEQQAAVAVVECP
jgi:glycine cleavage system H lipoate-binding protein